MSRKNLESIGCSDILEKTVKPNGSLLHFSLPSEAFAESWVKTSFTVTGRDDKHCYDIAEYLTKNMKRVFD